MPFIQSGPRPDKLREGDKYYIYKVGKEAGGFMGDGPDAVLEVPSIATYPVGTPVEVFEVTEEKFNEFIELLKEIDIERQEKNKD